jgi:hypothetical protein
MKISYKILFTFLFIAFSGLVFTSCSKSISSEKARLQVFLTDDPGDYQAVYIDVKDVMINVTGDSTSGWQSLANVNRGTYDLLTLVNDRDTLLANADIPSGKLHQLRLVLGTENFVKVNNQMIKLETPSAQQSGLKLNVQQNISNGLLYKIILDFDVAKSINKTGNNKYILKPVIRTVFESIGGSIKGNVTPYDFQTAVLVFRGPNDTVASTYSGLSNGGYWVKGLEAGTYSLHFKPANATYRDTVINGISVMVNKVTIVDTMKLK